jgi:hypothetical protein
VLWISVNFVRCRCWWHLIPKPAIFSHCPQPNCFRRSFPAARTDQPQVPGGYQLDQAQGKPIRQIQYVVRLHLEGLECYFSTFGLLSFALQSFLHFQTSLTHFLTYGRHAFNAQFPLLFLLFLSLLRSTTAQLVVGSSGAGCTDPPGSDPSEYDANGAGNLLADLIAATGVPAGWFAKVFITNNFASASGSAAGCGDLSGNSGGCALSVGPAGTTCSIVNQKLFDASSQTTVIETPETGKIIRTRFAEQGLTIINGSGWEVVHQRLWLPQGHEFSCRSCSSQH